jgi:phosphatidylinositol alpha-1,6-mannosyltransferase
VKTPLLAAVTLDAVGGGVAGVSRLVWQAFTDRWGSTSRLVELLPPAPPTLHPSALRRIRFGLELFREQLVADPWIFFTHLGLVRALGPVPRARRPPYAVFLHGVEAWRPLGSRERTLLEDAALIVANSEFTRRRVVALNPGLPSIGVCPLALEPSFAASVPDAPALAATRSQQPPTLAMVGRMASSECYKGHDQILEAWPFVRRAVPEGRLVLVGDGDDRPRLEAKAKALGLGGTVVFTGFVTTEERGRWYEQAHAFALPSRGEGFGLVYLEAMAYGLPCLGSSEDAAGEVICDGVTGWLAAQGDHARLVATMIALLSDRERSAAMGQAGRARVASEFSYARFAERIHRLVDHAFGVTAARLERGIA